MHLKVGVCLIEMAAFKVIKMVTFNWPPFVGALNRGFTQGF